MMKELIYTADENIKTKKDVFFENQYMHLVVAGRYLDLSVEGRNLYVNKVKEIEKDKGYGTLKKGY